MATSPPSAARVSRAARGARSRRPVTAYVVSGSGLGPGAVTPIRTATTTAGAPITVGTGPDAIAIT